VGKWKRRRSRRRRRREEAIRTCGLAIAVKRFGWSETYIPEACAIRCCAYKPNHSSLLLL
jgi:hypothetical protein